MPVFQYTDLPQDEQKQFPNPSWEGRARVQDSRDTATLHVVLKGAGEVHFGWQIDQIAT